MNPRLRKKLIIHAGMHKTGSTSLQAALARGGIPGVHTLRLGQSNHSQPCITLFAEHPEQHFAFRNRGLSASDLEERRRVLNRRLKRQIRNRAEEVFVLSAEWVSTAKPAEAARLRDRFAAHFEKIEVFAYVRPPVSFMTSSVQQSIKTGAVSFHLAWPNYQQRFEKLDQVFGRGNVCLRYFQPQEFRDGDVIQDFARWAELPIPDEPFDRRNTSMSAAGMALIACYRRNAENPFGSAERARRDRQIVNALMAVPSPRFEADPAMVQRVTGQNAEDLAWMENRIGAPMPQEQQAGRKDTCRIGSNADLKRAAAQFAPLLLGKASETPPDDPAEADAAAWDILAGFIRQLPVPETAAV